MTAPEKPEPRKPEPIWPPMVFVVVVCAVGYIIGEIRGNQSEVRSGQVPIVDKNGVNYQRINEIAEEEVCKKIDKDLKPGDSLPIECRKFSFVGGQP